MSFDPTDQQIRLPVEYHSGRFWFHNGNLPPIVDGATVELIIPTIYLDDDPFAEALKKERTELALREGWELRVVLLVRGWASLSEALQHNFCAAIPSMEPRLNGVYVSVYLLEPLQIRFRQAGQGELLPCKIAIPDLNLVADSLNEAYTLISQAFEPRRRSHTGNVFDKVYYIDFDSETWWSLSHLRKTLAERDTHSLYHQLFPWHYRYPDDDWLTWAYPQRTDGNKAVISIFAADGLVSAEHYFRSVPEAQKWLGESDYRRFYLPETATQDLLTEADQPEGINPPVPPYLKPNGETVHISYSIW